MIMNFCKSMKFQTRLRINNDLMRQVHEVRLLGLIISDTLKWNSNTDMLIKRAYKRVTILRKLTNFNIPISDLIHIYKLYVRSALEQSSVVWSASISTEEMNAFERCQKISLRVMYKEAYVSYDSALIRANLPCMSDQFCNLRYTFAKKCTLNEKTKHMFPLNEPQIISTRASEKYKTPFAYHSRFQKSAIIQMSKQLNEKY